MRNMNSTSKCIKLIDVEQLTLIVKQQWNSALR